MAFITTSRTCGHHTVPSPADNDEELDEEQRVRGAAVVLGATGEVERTVP